MEYDLYIPQQTTMRGAKKPHLAVDSAREVNGRLLPLKLLKKLRLMVSGLDMV
jgi:hypothetical protein